MAINRTGIHRAGRPYLLRLVMLLVLIIGEASFLPLLTGCTRKIGSGSVVMHRKIRKEVLAETLKAQVSQSELPPLVKKDVSDKIDATPEAESDREQIALLIQAMVKSLKANNTKTELIAKLSIASVSNLSEQNLDPDSDGSQGLLQRPELELVVKLLTENGVPESEIMQAVIRQLDPFMANNSSELSSILKDPLFSGFAPSAKTAVRAVFGDPDAQMHEKLAGKLGAVIDSQGLPDGTAVALKTAIENVAVLEGTAAQAETFVTSLVASARNQNIEAISRTILVLDAVDAIVALATESEPVSSESLLKTALESLESSGVAASELVSKVFSRFEENSRNTVGKIDALLASPVFSSISAPELIAVKDSLILAYVPAPVMRSLANQITTEETALNNVSFVVQSSGSNLSCEDSIRAISSNTSLLPSASIIVSGTEPDCSLSLIPSLDQNGLASVTLTISDGPLSSQGAFSLVVSPVNDRPTVALAGDGSKIVNQDNATSVDLMTATDPDVLTNGQELSYLLLSAPVHGTLGSFPNSPVLDSSVTYNPNSGYLGSDSFSYQICDSSIIPECTAAKTVSLNVVRVNAAPTDISLSSSAINENGGANLVVGNLSSTDPDFGDSFVYTLIGGTSSTDNAAFNLNGNALRLTASADFETKSSYEVRVRSTDYGGLFFEKAITISINDVNETPTDVTLSASAINENAGVNATIGGIFAGDPDAGDSFAYTLVAGVGSTDNAAFNISGNMLRLTGSADFETKSSYSLRIRAVDSGSLFLEQAFTVTINDVSEDPTDIALSASSLNENAGTNAIVGVLSSVDADAANTFTYTLVAGTSSVDNSAFNILGNNLRMNASGDYEAKSTFSVRVRSTDNTSRFFEKELTISVLDVAEAPTDLTLSAAAINENAPANTSVGTFSSSDPDTGDTFTYTLVAGSGSTDNASFAISGNSLSLNGSADFETKSSYSIRVRSTDSTALFVEKTLTVAVNDLPEWRPEAYIKPANSSANTMFGLDFGGAVSVSADTLAVSAQYEESLETTISNGTTASFDQSGMFVGAVYVYRRSGTNWAQEAYIKKLTAASHEYFGKSISLYGDTLAVGTADSSNQTTISNGTTASSDTSLEGSGAVFVYRRSGLVWSQEAYIKSSNSNWGDSFGYRVSLSGNLLAASAYAEDSNQTTVTNGPGASSNNSVPDSGAVYIFRRTGVNWAQEAYLKTPNPDPYDGLTSVSLSGDTIAVGALNEDSNLSTVTNGTTASTDNSATDAGAVYIYRRTGVNWAQEAFLKAANAAAGDEFGYSLSLAGELLAVGTSKEDSNQTAITMGTTASADNSAANAGAVYVYRRTGVNWAQEAFVKAANAQANDYFGEAVSLSGNVLAIGAIGESSNQATISNGTLASANNSSAFAGAVYVYRRTGGSWAQEAYMKAANSNADDCFGARVSLSGDTLAVGAVYEDSNQSTVTNGSSASSDNSNEDSGAVYVYRNTSQLFDPPDVIASSTAAGSFVVSWTAANTGSGNGNYKVVYDTAVPAAGCSSGITAYQGTAATVTVSSGLTAGQTYNYRVCSTDGSTFSEGIVGRVTVFENVAPTTVSINRGSTSDPVPLGTSFVDYVVTFSEAVTGVVANNFTLSEVTTTNGASGQVQSVSCNGPTCTVWVATANAGSLRLDLSSASGIKDNWDNALATTRIGDEAYTLQGWYPEAYVKAANAGTNDNFGYSVSLSGDTLAVGAYGEGSTQNTITNGTTASTVDSAAYAGAAYVYLRSGSTWTQQAYVKAANAETTDNFGYSVSLSGDSLAVGAYGEGSTETTITNGTTASSNNLAGYAGAVYIYLRTASNWAQQAYIKAANAAAGDRFGTSVFLAGDNLAVGAWYEDSNETTITSGTTASADNSASNSGAVYLYRRTGTNWEQEAYVKASNAGAFDGFGWGGVASAGDTLTVGAVGESSNQTTVTNGTTASADNTFTSSGAVYVYRRTGASWAQEAYIKAGNANALDSFGGNVGLSGDTIAVGAIGESSNLTVVTNGTTASSNNTAAGAGAVYVYRRSGTSWAQEAFIKATNAAAGDKFAQGVSLSGNTLIVGAIQEDSIQSMISNGTAASADNSAADAGAVYVFRRNGVNWSQEAYVKASNAAPGDYFGYSVSLSGDTFAVGAYGEDSNQSTITNGTSASANNSATDSGAVYVYRSSSRLFDPDIRVSTQTTTSITFAWSTNLGTASPTPAIIVAPAATGTGSAAACQLAGGGGSVTLSAGTSTYTYTGLTTGTKYGFRFCTTDGTTISPGTTIWANTQ